MGRNRSEPGSPASLQQVVIDEVPDEDPLVAAKQDSHRALLGSGSSPVRRPSWIGHRRRPSNLTKSLSGSDFDPDEVPLRGGHEAKPVHMQATEAQKDAAGEQAEYCKLRRRRTRHLAIKPI